MAVVTHAAFAEDMELGYCKAERFELTESNLEYVGCCGDGVCENRQRFNFDAWMPIVTVTRKLLLACGWEETTWNTPKHAAFLLHMFGSTHKDFLL